MKTAQPTGDAKRRMVENPGKEDVHEQRETNQRAEGVVDAAPVAAPKPHPWRRKLAGRAPKRSGMAVPPATPDTKNRPD